MRRVACGVVVLGIIFAPGAASADAVPYTDPSATGSITLCDTQGHVMTHGSIYGKPFAWRAVASSAAPNPYNGAGRTAALYGYQPIKDVDPAQWNGEFLTAGARYTSPAHPMAAATALDPTLADLLIDYPTKWDGLIQLRMFLGVPQEPTLTRTYATATIKVAGDTWTMLQGGAAGCDSGTALSSENVLPQVRSAGTPAPGYTQKPSSSGRVSPAGAAPSTTPGSSRPASQPGSPATAASSTQSESSSATPWVIAAVIVLLLAGGIVWYRLRASDAGR